MVHHARLPRKNRAAPTKMIEFTQEELDVLEIVTWHVGGSPDGPRGVLDRAAAKLRAEATPPSKRDGRTVEVQGSIFIRYTP